MKLKDPLENQICLRKRVSVIERSQAYVFSGPRAEALRLKKRFSKCDGVLSLRKGNRSSENAAAEIPTSLFPSDSGPDVVSIGCRPNVRSGKPASPFSRHRVTDFIAISAYDLTDKI